MSIIKPTFIFIGPGRSATTWIYSALKMHPEIGLAKSTKETSYFTSEFWRGEEWYLNHFCAHENKISIGEVCNEYIYNPLVAHRIKEALPEVKLIAVLRNPLERIWSVYHYRKRRGGVYSNITHAIGKDHDLLANNYYWDLLRPYYECFNSDQIKIFFYDDLVEDSGLFLDKIFVELGVEKLERGSVKQGKINKTESLRFSFFGKIASYVADRLREADLLGTLLYLKESRLVKFFLYGKGATKDTEKFPLELQKEIIDALAKDIEKLSKLTGRDLQSWLEPIKKLA